MLRKEKNVCLSALTINVLLRITQNIIEPLGLGKTPKIIDSNQLPCPSSHSTHTVSERAERAAMTGMSFAQTKKATGQEEL